LENGGLPVLIDIRESAIQELGEQLSKEFSTIVPTYNCDIRNEETVNEVFIDAMKKNAHSVHSLGLINNAALNPKVESSDVSFQRPENLSKSEWDLAFDVGLYGALVCSNAFYRVFCQQGLSQGSVVNVSSDHGLISPKQSLYFDPTKEKNDQPLKPITYTLIKHALIGMTRYFSTLWANEGIRVNTLCPGGVFANQDEFFLEKFAREVPMGRMAQPDEYRGSIVFLLSKDSSYMTGATLVIDGGRTVW
jgi:NAD(P)-dependent dehydrogenase (short-subunit alcohol dehydrogenase family)